MNNTFYLSIYLSLYLSISLSLYLSISLSLYLSISLSLYLSISLSLYLSVYLSIYLSIYLSTYLPTYLSIYLSIHLSIYPSIHLSKSIYLSYVCVIIYIPRSYLVLLWQKRRQASLAQSNHRITCFQRSADEDIHQDITCRYPLHLNVWFKLS